jgi:hypothetical protein
MGAEIDAVIIGTPDHTHAAIALEAMRRGKHVYCEKPLAHTVDEVRRMMAVARETGVITQLGNQGHSSGDIRRLCEWVWDGAIGTVREVHAGCDAFPEVYSQIRTCPKSANVTLSPEHLDYDLWLGPVPFVPYSPLWVHWNWRGWLPSAPAASGTGSAMCSIPPSGPSTSMPRSVCRPRSPTIRSRPARPDLSPGHPRHLRVRRPQRTRPGEGRLA